MSRGAQQLPLHRQQCRNDTSLDLLINNELPVVVEEVVLPDGGEFHGRAVGFRYL